MGWCLGRYAECESKFRYYINNSFSLVVRKQNRERAGWASKPKERWNSGNRSVHGVSSGSFALYSTESLPVLWLSWFKRRSSEYGVAGSNSTRTRFFTISSLNFPSNQHPVSSNLLKC